MFNLNIFEFNEDDIRSNRNGFISSRQEEWLAGLADGVRNAGRGGVWIVLFFMLLGFGMVFGLMLSTESGRDMFLANPLGFWPVLCVFPVVFALLWLGRYLAGKRADQLADSTLQKVDGVVKIEKQYDSKSGPYYDVYVGDRKFAFAESVSDIFKEGEKHRVYYCETKSFQLVFSVERL